MAKQKPSANDWREASQIIDTQLHGALCLFNGVYREAGYWFIDSDRSFVGASGIEAFINNIYCFEPSLVTWSGLQLGTDIWLYIKTIEDELYPGSREGGKFETCFSTSCLGICESQDRICVAKRNADGTLDTSPPCKRYIYSPGDHSNQHNPHGTPLYQNTIIADNVTAISGEGPMVDAETFALDDEDQTLSIDTVNILYSGVASQAEITGRVINAFISGTELVQLITNTLSAPYITMPQGRMTHDLIVASGITVDGVDIDVLGSDFSAHDLDTNNPHQVNAAQIEALSISGGTLLGDLELLSGLTVDGIDVSELIGLINGSGTDLHQHWMEESPKKIFLASSFQGAVINNDQNFMRDWYTGTRNVITFRADSLYCNSDLVLRIGVPKELRKAKTLEIEANISRSESFINLRLWGTDNQPIVNVMMSGAGLHDYWYNISGGVFTPGEFMTLMFTFSGVPFSMVELGEGFVEYLT